METTESFTAPEAEPGAVLSFEAQVFLQEAGKWANFLGITGFIFCTIFLITSLFIGTIISLLGAINPLYASMPPLVGIVVSFVCILLDILYFFFALYLYQFASKIKSGLTLGDTDVVTMAFGKLKSFFKLWGITTIVMLCIYALEIVVVVLATLTVKR
jgi:hypothetical protein